MGDLILVMIIFSIVVIITVGAWIFYQWFSIYKKNKALKIKSKEDFAGGSPKSVRQRLLKDKSPTSEVDIFNANVFISYVKQALENAKAVSGLPQNQMNMVMGMQIAAQRILDDFGGSPRSKPGTIQYLQDMIEASKINKGRLPPNRKNVAIGIEELAASLIREINAGRFDAVAREERNGVEVVEVQAVVNDVVGMKLTIGTSLLVPALHVSA